MPVPIGMDIFTASYPDMPESERTNISTCIPEIEPQPILLRFPVAEAIHQTLHCSFCNDLPSKTAYEYYSCEGGHFVCPECQDVSMDRCMKAMEADYVPPGNDLIENGHLNGLIENGTLNGLIENDLSDLDENESLNDPINTLDNNCQNIYYYGMPTPHPLLTKMLETCKFTCKYRLGGCYKERLCTQLKEHEERCKYNPKNMEMAPGELSESSEDEMDLIQF